MVNLLNRPKKNLSPNKVKRFYSSPYLPPVFKGRELAPAFHPVMEPVAVASKGLSLSHSG
jgi:hypothetical protein